MVTSVDGAVTLDGRSKEISSAADWWLFGLQRALADVIVVGAGTARAEGYGPVRARPEFAHRRTGSGQPPAPRRAVVTATAELDPEARFFSGAEPTIVITRANADAARVSALRDVAEVLVCGQDAVDLRAALDALRDRGLGRVLSEGGPRLLGAMTSADLLDEVVCSITPLLAGGDSARMVTGASSAPRPLTLAGVLEQDHSLFLHYRRGTGSPPRETR